MLYENGNPINPTAVPSAATASLDQTTLTSIDDYNTGGFTNQYQCVITNSYGSVTSVVATLTVTVNPTPPIITSGTNLVTGFVGGNIDFAPVTAIGTQPFSYQWYSPNGTKLVDDGVKYVGSTAASLTVSNLQPTDAGSYYMVIMNPSIFYASNVVDVLTVNYVKVQITGQPQPGTTFVGTPITLTAGEAGGSSPITNQWFEGSTMLSDGGEYSGSATASLTIAANTTADSGNNYYLVVSNPGGYTTSSIVSATVVLPPAHSFVGYTNQVYIQPFD